jgi:hypothetical protein
MHRTRGTTSQHEADEVKTREASTSKATGKKTQSFAVYFAMLLSGVVLVWLWSAHAAIDGHHESQGFFHPLAPGKDEEPFKQQPQYLRTAVAKPKKVEGVAVLTTVRPVANISSSMSSLSSTLTTPIRKKNPRDTGDKPATATPPILAHAATVPRSNHVTDTPSIKSHAKPSEPEPEDDESYYVVFSTGCSEFQDWQSIGVYSSAETVGQRGIVTRIASGCTSEQEAAIRHSVSHLPKRCRVHFAPNTEVRDVKGSIYKYANKPLGMMHWLMHAEPPVPKTATIALIDPDFFFLRPLWHDSFDSPTKYIATGSAQNTPVPKIIKKGTMIAQQYGIGGAPWTKKPSNKPGKKAWALKEFFTKNLNRPNSPALHHDITESTAGTWYSIGAPYIALASDWLPLATNWTNLMPMAVERNFGNLAEMYAMVIATADLNIRPARIDNMMVSNVGSGGEGWPWVDKLPMDKACDPSILTDPKYALPIFLHYCQTYRINSISELSHGAEAANMIFSKYQVPDEILKCPAGSTASEGIKELNHEGSQKKMRLTKEGFLPEPSPQLTVVKLNQLRNVFSHCTATRSTNKAAADYRRWFCSVSHGS